MKYVGRITASLDTFLTARRLKLWALVLLVLVYAFVARYFWDGMSHPGASTAPFMGDFAGHMVGGHLVLAGHARDLFDPDQQAAIQKGFLGAWLAGPLESYQHVRDTQATAVGRALNVGEKWNIYMRLALPHYVSPPFVSYLYAPLAWLPYTASALVWLLLTVMLVVVSLRLFWPLVPRFHRYGFAHLLLVALSAAPVFAVLLVGQDAALSLLLFVLGLRLLQQRRDAAAGAVLGLGVFKPQLFILMPVLLLLQRRWRALVAWLLVAGMLTRLSLYMVGPEGTWSYLALLTSDSYRARIDLSQASSMLSLIALVRSLGFDRFASVVGGAVAFLLALGFGPIAVKARGERSFALLYAAAILMTVLISPHAFVYDGLVLFVPALVLLHEAQQTPAVRLSLAAAYLLTWLVPLHFGSAGPAPWVALLLGVLLLVTRRLLLRGEAGAAQGLPLAHPPFELSKDRSFAR